MPTSNEPKHYIAKHDLVSLKVLPNYVWNTTNEPNEYPEGFERIRPGHRWIAFAYTTDDNKERPLSLITGFYECEEPARYQPIPPEAIPFCNGKTEAWMIKGKECGEQPKHPVGVPPLDDKELLGRATFHQSTFVPISAEEFDRVRKYALSHWFDPALIPLLGREPENEQELLALVAQSHKGFGIEKIIKVQKAFPDLLVEIIGHPDEVHLELEVYSEGFFSHGHDKQVVNRCFIGDKIPVAVLCWIDNSKVDNNEGRKLRDYVHEVYELRSLIRRGEKTVW
jgi:hypothetical protein